MSQVTPPSKGPPATAHHAAPAGVPGTVANAPRAVAELASGTTLQGTVLRQDARGHVSVLTELGTLKVSTAARLESGSQVTLQIRAAGSQLHVAVLQVDGHPAGRRGAALPPPAGSAGAPGTAAGARDVLALGQAVRAVVHGVPNASAAGEPRLPALSVGSRISLQVLRVQAPAGPTVPGQAAPAVPGPVVASARGDSFTVPGLVSQHTPRGQPVVRTALGTIVLELRSGLPAGTRLLLSLPAPGPTQVATMPPPQAWQAGAMVSGWPALMEAIKAVERLDGPAGGAAPAELPVPRPGPRLGSTLLLFLQAVAGGELRGWLGDAARALQGAGRGDLLARLDREFARLGTLADSAGSDWRFLPVPLFDGARLHQLRFYLRRRGGGGHRGRAGPEGEATRFLVELELATLGDMQLDGLVRKKRFDLILRTRKALSQAMRQDIAEIFHEANSAAGKGGRIGFQASGDWRFMPLRPRAGGDGGLVV